MICRRTLNCVLFVYRATPQLGRSDACLVALHLQPSAQGRSKRVVQERQANESNFPFLISLLLSFL